MADTSTSDRKTDGHIAYGLYAASFLIPFAGIAGVIFCYMKRTAHDDGVWDSHMTWLIRTFWIALAAVLVSLVLLFIAIGGLTMIAVAIWSIYRIIKGWIYWNDGKALENPEGLF